MFKYQEVIDAFRNHVRSDIESDLSHCQLLNVKARELGFQNYNHFRDSLKGLPEDQFWPVSLTLMRQICQAKLPSLDCPYFEFTSWPGRAREIGFYSEWVGWDATGDEVRVPRPLCRSHVSRLRDFSNHPIYVVETETALLAWHYRWGAAAYIPESLAKSYFPLFFSRHSQVANPPIELIKAKVRKRMERLNFDIGEL